MELNQKWADEFFSVISDALILKRKETNTIEFKCSFEWAAKEFKSTIAKSAAAFANRDGGLIIFGVENKPHKLIGIENFNDIDDACISTYFNEIFSPSIEFQRHSFVVKDKVIGVLQIFTAKNKPVICIKDSPKTFDSDIYYRYSAMSSKIKSGDLIYLIQETKDNDKNRWMTLLSNIALVGVENVALLNSVSGELASPNNNSFLIDESILNQLKILDKYSESEDGSPAVRIIGKVESAAKIIERQKNIFEEDIFSAFLTQDLKSSGMEYLSAILRMNSEYYPIYFFFNSSGVDSKKRHETLELVKTRSKNKSNVLARLSDDSKLESKKSQYSFKSPKWGASRQEYYNGLISNTLADLQTENDCKLLLESVFSLEKDNFDLHFVSSQLNFIFNNFYPFDKDGINHVFRWALAYLDNVTYKMG